VIITYTSGATLPAPGNLWSEIQTYTNNYEGTFVSDIPTFVQAAEERVYNSVQLPALRKNQMGTSTGGVKYLALPSDWLATYSLALADPNTGVQSFLINKDVNFIREAYPDGTAQGTPVYYAQFDFQTLIMGPTPDNSYPAEIHYYYYPTSIVTATTTWLGNNFGEVLLYGSIREAYVYMKGEKDVLDMYEAKYQEGLALLKRLGDGLDRRDAYRSGQARVPVT
jgi:hypothetical protein